MGFQKFVDIKCRISGLRPSAAVDRRNGAARSGCMARRRRGQRAGKPRDRAAAPAPTDPDAAPTRRREPRAARPLSLRSTACRRGGHQRLRDDDEPWEVAVSARWPRLPERGTRSWRATSRRAVTERRSSPVPPGPRRRPVRPDFRFLDADDATLRNASRSIADPVYGADGADISGGGRKQLEESNALATRTLPVCMAKTQSSLSHDPALKGRPTGFRVPIREARLLPGPGSSPPTAATCAPCPGSRPIRTERASTSTRTADRGPVLARRLAAGPSALREDLADHDRDHAAGRQSDDRYETSAPQSIGPTGGSPVSASCSSSCA